MKIVKQGTAVDRRLRGLGALMMSLGLSLPMAAMAAVLWWNADYSARVSVTVDTAAAGLAAQQSVDDLPVLLRLHDGNFEFARAAANGADLRVVAGDEQTPLSFHIESWDNVFNLGFVWVRMPKLANGAPAGFRLYYGNSQPGAGAMASAETYDAAQKLVYHFAESDGAPQDATANGNNAVAAVSRTDAGQVGWAAHFDGATSLQIPASASLDAAAAAPRTISFWFKPGVAPADGVIYALQDGSLGIGLTGGIPYMDLAGRRVQAAAPIADAAWHHLALIADQNQSRLLLDGVEVATGPALAALSGTATLGGDAQSHFSGDIDEFGIAAAARSDAWIRMLVASQGPSGGIAQFGVTEHAKTDGGHHGSYLVSILASVTTDGWTILGLLAVLALVSWYVMAAKADQVQRVARANSAFRELYQELGNRGVRLEETDITLHDGSGLNDKRKALIEDSPLFHLLKRGLEEMRRRTYDAKTGKRSHETLSVASIEAIRAELDAGIVEETQDLNRLMVLLTIAIAGGPFLGLLGTVLGVMITFAAIAASGDVNVNAIAPGVAAALTTTVGGLTVAIPALFGYNYLITRINSVTATMQVFMDAFVARLAEAFDEQRPRAIAEPRQ